MQRAVGGCPQPRTQRCTQLRLLQQAPTQWRISVRELHISLAKNMLLEVDRTVKIALIVNVNALLFVDQRSASSTKIASRGCPSVAVAAAAVAAAVAATYCISCTLR